MDKSELHLTAYSALENERTEQATELILTKPLLEQVLGSLELPGHFQAAESMIDKVVEVSEHVQMNELILERRHEVKDFASKELQLQQIPAHINKELSKQLETRTDSSLSDPQIIPMKHKSFIKTLIDGQSLSAYAVKYSFLSAMLALLIAVITVNLFT